MDIEDIYKRIDNDINNAYVLAIFENKVELGYYCRKETGNDCSKEIHFYNSVNFDLCSQLRIFNKDKELRILKVDDKIYTKVISEENYKNILNDEYMFISGNKILKSDKNDNADNDDKNDFTLLEQVKRKVAVPIQINEEQLGKGIRLVVRNYFDIDENNQVIISESRLVGLSLDGKEVM